MFGKKVLVTALLAIVLLTSFTEGGVYANLRHRRKPRAAEAESVAYVVPVLARAGLAELVNQAAASITAAASDSHQALIKSRKPRRKGSADEDSQQTLVKSRKPRRKGSIDPASYQAALKDRKPRRPRQL